MSTCQLLHHVLWRSPAGTSIRTSLPSSSHPEAGGLLSPLPTSFYSHIGWIAEGGKTGVFL